MLMAVCRPPACSRETNLTGTTRADPTLDTQIQLVVFDKCFWIYFHYFWFLNLFFNLKFKIYVTSPSTSANT
jgi:hypothetical protein